MPIKRSAISRPQPQLSIFLLGALLAVLWLSGGSSRSDVLGQVVLGFATWGAIALLCVFGPRISFEGIRPVFWLMAGCVAIPLLQLIPLPEPLWSSLSGREFFENDPVYTEDQQHWRPMSISPSATLGALISLTVPVAVLILMSALKETEKRWLPTILFFLVIASVLVGLIQFSGAGFRHPLINYIPGSVSGTFANRNHFALLLAIGCLIASVWAFTNRDAKSWRVPFAISLILLTELLILASGSRAGMGLGVISLFLGAAIVREDIARVFRNAPRWFKPAAISALIGIIVALVAASVFLGRATSVDRLATVGGDMRSIGLPTVVEIIRAYFPFGVGVGGFDSAFRIFEPDDILQIFYFNHVHSDWLELALETGIVGIILMAFALVWWARASRKVWKRSKSGSPSQIYARLGSAIILLVLLASVVDYPARTPLIMTFVAIAACWLAWGEQEAANRASLPEKR